MATANNWILTGALRPADVGIRRARKPRLFSVVTIFDANVTGDLVKWLGMPPSIAAGMGRKTTDGHKLVLVHSERPGKEQPVLRMILELRRA